METNPCDMNQLDCDSHLPPRKRLLAGFKKLNSNGNGSSSSPSAFASSSSSTSNSNGSSSSASTEVQTHLDYLLLASRFDNGQNLSPEELVETTRSAAALAVKAAKAARAMANEKALISAKAIAAAKRALELLDSFPKEAMDAVGDRKERSPKKNKQKKQVPVELLYSKGQLRDEEEDLARRLHRAIDDRYLKVFGASSDIGGHINKKQRKNKTVTGVTGSVNDISGVVDSDSSYEGLESNRKATRTFESDGIPTPGKEESKSLGKRRGRVKLKKLPLSICNSRDQENGTSSASPLRIAQPREDGVISVIPGTASWKCQDLKAPECGKQNKAVRS
ncbi:hypothetical protein EUTSA_v10025668mg [Eutrema salsugineum]|uniref:Uncharacterized protein n=1 Tax=Eutrema salsugineum TaxID=72664 RepID=V4MLG3_EUTSA|nr:uncharacterized protein LOC18028280 [Eutrema salsugineum]ESQ53548.1 hypothetical protein EUTSA_v10025668mg [Eutrema salsugineum]